MDDDTIPIEPKDDSSDVKEHALNFPWSLVTTCSDILGVDQKQPRWLWNTIASPRLRLFLWGIIFLLSLISGLLGFFIGSCYELRTLTFLIVQGTIGLFVVWIKADTSWFGYSRRLSLKKTKSHRSEVFCFFVLSDILTLFCVAWFFIGPKWAYTGGYRLWPCTVSVREITPTILLLHYIMGVCSLIGFLFDSPTILRWFQKQIQFQLDYLSQEDLRRKKMYIKKSTERMEKDALGPV